MATIIIGVHGLANKPKESVLHSYWQKAIAEGLQVTTGTAPAIPLEMVYWAGHLYKEPLHNDRHFWFDDLYNDEPYRKAVAGGIRERKDGVVEWLVARAQQLTGGIGDILYERLGADRIAVWLLGRILKDLAFYYAQEPISDGRGGKAQADTVLRQRVIDALTPHKNDDVMLIAHSMGSIIAYDALRDLGQRDPDFRVAHFVTIGSPLGLATVKNHVWRQRTYDDTNARLRTPTIVERWTNYADRRDPVAADPHLADDYGANSRGIQVRDDMIYNDYAIKKRGRKKPDANPHKSYGYLRTPEMSRLIDAFL